MTGYNALSYSFVIRIMNNIYNILIPTSWLSQIEYILMPNTMPCLSLILSLQVGDDDRYNVIFPLNLVYIYILMLTIISLSVPHSLTWCQRDVRINGRSAEGVWMASWSWRYRVQCLRIIWMILLHNALPNVLDVDCKTTNSHFTKNIVININICSTEGVKQLINNKLTMLITGTTQDTVSGVH